MVMGALRLTLCFMTLASVATLDLPLLHRASLPSFQPFSSSNAPGELVMPSRAGHSGLLGDFSQMLNQKKSELRNPFQKPLLMAKKTAQEVWKHMDLEKYPKLFFAGGFCAAITHVVTVPIDVVKTKMQVCNLTHFLVQEMRALLGS